MNSYVLQNTPGVSTKVITRDSLLFGFVATTDRFLILEILSLWWLVLL